MKKFLSILSKAGKATSNVYNKIGIDLGTSNTVVSFNGEIVYNEPTTIVLNNKTNSISAMGSAAFAMIGRTPNHLEIVEPVLDGVISNYEVTEELIRYILSTVGQSNYKILGPSVGIGIPSVVNEVQIQTLHDATLNAGARSVYIVPEPYAAAIGMGLNKKVVGPYLVIDIGGGTTDIMIFAFGGVVASGSIKTACKSMNKSIAEYFKNKHQTEVGTRSTEKLKVTVLSGKYKDVKNFYVHGRNMLSGLPQKLLVTKAVIKQIVYPQISEISKAVKKLIAEVPADTAADLLNGKGYLVGGGALIEGLEDYLSKELQIPIVTPKDPLTVVAKGAEQIASEPEMHKYGIMECTRQKPHNI